MYGNLIDVYFDGGNARSIGHVNTYEEAWKVMSDFLHDAEKKSPNFHWYYTRISFLPDQKTLRMDVSSHTEFILFIFDTQEQYDEAVRVLCDKQAADREPSRE